MKKVYLVMLSLLATNCVAQETDLNSLRLIDGFSVSIYAELENPRQLALGSNNTVYVGSLRGRVFAITNSDGAGHGDNVVMVAERLNTPNGVAYHDGDLYIGEIGRISKIENIDNKLSL